MIRKANDTIRHYAGFHIKRVPVSYSNNWIIVVRSGNGFVIHDGSQHNGFQHARDAVHVGKALAARERAEVQS